MKKVILILFIFVLFLPNALSERKINPGPRGEYTLEPGIYITDIDIPSGYYDVRIEGLSEYCTIRYTPTDNLDDSMNMNDPHSYTLTFSSAGDYWQGCHPNILLGSCCYLEIENSTCVFYPITIQEY